MTQRYFVQILPKLRKGINCTSTYIRTSNDSDLKKLIFKRHINAVFHLRKKVVQFLRNSCCELGCDPVHESHTGLCIETAFFNEFAFQFSMPNYWYIVV